MAKVVRAPPKDFHAVRQEWAAIRIQTAFRGVLVKLFFKISRNPFNAVHGCLLRN